MFDTVQNDLTIKPAEIRNVGDLQNAVFDSIGAIGNSVGYFENVGM